MLNAKLNDRMEDASFSKLRVGRSGCILAA